MQARLAVGCRSSRSGVWRPRPRRWRRRRPCAEHEPVEVVRIDDDVRAAGRRVGGGEGLGVASRGGRRQWRAATRRSSAAMPWPVCVRGMLARRDGGRGQAERAEVPVDVDQVRVRGVGSAGRTAASGRPNRRAALPARMARLSASTMRAVSTHIERGLDRVARVRPSRTGAGSAPTWLTTVSSARKCARRLVSRNRCGQRVERGQAIAELRVVAAEQHHRAVAFGRGCADRAGVAERSTGSSSGHARGSSGAWTRNASLSTLQDCVSGKKRTATAPAASTRSSSAGQSRYWTGFSVATG